MATTDATRTETPEPDSKHAAILQKLRSRKVPLSNGPPAWDPAGDIKWVQADDARRRAEALRGEAATAQSGSRPPTTPPRGNGRLPAGGHPPWRDCPLPTTTPPTPTMPRPLVTTGDRAPATEPKPQPPPAPTPREDKTEVPADSQADRQPVIINSGTVSARLVNGLPALDPPPGKQRQPSYRPVSLRLEDSGIPERLNAAAPGAWALLELMIRNADRDASGVARPKFTTIMRRLGLQNRKATWTRIRLLERGKPSSKIPPTVKRVRPNVQQWTVREDELIQWILRLEAERANRRAARSAQNRENGRKGLDARYGKRPGKVRQVARIC